MAVTSRPRGYFDALFRPVTRKHLETACRRVLRDGVPRQRAGRSSFVRFNGQLLPAKYVLGLAFHSATGCRLSPDAYHGGQLAARIIERRGIPTVARRDGPPARNAGVQAGRTFVTVAIAGRNAERPSQNFSRLALMKNVLARIRQARWKPTLVLFPGGYFKIALHLGPLADRLRLRRLQALPLARNCRNLAQETGATLVVGIDGASWKRPGYQDADWADQLCVAWTGQGIVGVGRKIFPVSGDESRWYTVYRPHFGTLVRRPRMGNGNTALLCSCYDMFGCSESPRSPGQRTRNIYWLGDGARNLWERASNAREMRSLLREDLTRWQSLVRSADVGLAAVHHFTRHGPQSGKGYWQRHGVEQASRHLKGRLAFGAAHFEPPLPPAHVAVLAAQAGRPLAPSAHFVQSSAGVTALVRRFDVK
jgi:hypothetical protein